MESDEEENDPFQSMDCNLFEERKTTSRPRAVHRDWGIPTFNDQIDRGILSFTLTKLQDPSKSITIVLEHRKHSTGSDLWDSALVLAHNLEGLVHSMEGKTVLELGSGTGAVGLYCSRCLGAKHVVLTDLPENLELLQRNRDANGIPETLVSIAPLDWMSEDLPDAVLSGVDLIVGSDLCKFLGEITISNHDPFLSIPRPRSPAIRSIPSRATFQDDRSLACLESYIESNLGLRRTI